MKKIACFTLMCMLVTILFTGCSRRESYYEAEDYEMPQANDEGTVVAPVTMPTDEEIIENLALLGKVWGFAKYHHPSFLTGRYCWDAELLRLIPPVRAGGDVRGILYEWFTGLGGGEDLPYGVYFNLANLVDEIEYQMGRVPDFVNDLILELRDFVEHFGSMVQRERELDWQEFQEILVERFPLAAASILREEEGLSPMADLTWLNYENLGPLAAHMLRIGEIRVVGRRAAPVHFQYIFDPAANFFNQSRRPGNDFRFAEDRLLTLFRLWNGMNYFFAHLDVLDVPWNDLLPKYITKMLESTDRLSYELTLASLTHHLRDPVLFIQNASFFASKFGGSFVPVLLVQAEGRVVVYEVLLEDVPLERGDVIFSVDGRYIDDVISEMTRFNSIPNDDMALTILSGRWFPWGRRGSLFPGEPHLLTTHGLTMDIEVFRGIFGMTERVVTSRVFINFPQQDYPPHVLLDENIGLINHAEPEDIRYIMESFAYTEGIIIDLRRMSNPAFTRQILKYLTETPLPFMYVSHPSRNYPGKRFYTLRDVHPSERTPYTFMYNRPVVLLMDEQISGSAEWMLMSLRAAPNVTAIGTPSMGSVGGAGILPLPGNKMVRFSSTGRYTPDGGPIHRVGITPDIRVERTIQGIADGRDEIMEAAVRFILGD